MEGPFWQSAVKADSRFAGLTHRASVAADLRPGDGRPSGGTAARAGLALLAGTLLAGCSSMSLDEIALNEPAFSFVGFFEGPVRASGFFTNRFGTVSQHFCGDFIGTADEDGGLTLDETLYYTSGVTEKRVWNASETADGRFSATADSLDGPVDGQIQGNTLAMDYTMEVLIGPDERQTFDMQDYMFLQPDGTLQNLTKVYKWGIRVGYVSTFFTPHDGSEPCVN